MSGDPKIKWPHKEMPIIGKTKEGYRIAQTHNCKPLILAPGQEAVEFFYNGPTLRELSGGK